VAEGPLPENSDTAIRVFIGLCALACVFGSVDAARDSDGLHFVIFFVVAVLISVFDLYWMRFKAFSRRTPLIPALLIVGGIGLFILGVILARQNTSHQTAPQSAASEKAASEMSTPKDTKPASASAAPLPLIDVDWKDDNLIINNVGDRAFYLCGTKTGDLPPKMAIPPQLVRPHTYTYTPKPGMKEATVHYLGLNGKTRLPVNAYLLDENKTTKFIGKFGLLVEVVNGVVSVRTQVYDVVQENWE
jgi:hypothetical protein